MKKKTFFHSFLFLYFLFLNGASFGQITHWVQKAGSPGNDEGYDISIDANGNTYTTGYFSGTAAFGSTTLTAYGVTDIFITKTDSLGIFKWAVKAGSTGSDRGLSIKADAAGNSYITGFYYGTATFGSTTITSAGVQDIFIAKYNTAGVLQWVQSAGGTEPDIGNGINVDNAGNVLVTGEFKGTASFGSFSLTSMNSSIDVFTTKLDAAGNFLWAEQGAAPYIDRGIDVAADAAGNIYVTGEFTDTITFDVTHLNTIYNAIFIVKYNSAGDEQWFKKIGGGTLNLVSGIAVDAAANVYVTGDFTGNLIFFGPPNVTITNTYSNRIFTAKCDSNGNLLWADADGSDGEITSRNIALDAAGNPFIIGNFKCRLNDYADQYGQGTFNSIGFWDTFVTKYSTAGIRQWSRQYGSKADDYGGGIALDLNNDANIAGSFQRTFMFPYSGTLIGYSTYNITSWWGYCSDPLYGEYEGFSSSGNAEILVADIVDPAREPYDYYQRYGTGCTKPYIGVCIDDYNYYYNNCPDSIEFCGEGELHANSQTTQAGPDFNYLWSTGETYDYISVNTSGYYSVTQTSADGCFVSSDSVYVTIHPIPPRPTISDDHGINTNATYPLTIELCGDSALLTGGGFGGLTHWWTGPTGSYISTTDMATVSGVYSFFDSTIYGCVSQTSVWVIIDTALSPFNPGMYCVEDSIHGNDSITLCFGQHFYMYIYDSISNPNGDPGCIPNDMDATIYWSVNPDTAIYYYPVVYDPCDTWTYTQTPFQPYESGTYIINAMIVRGSNCDADTVYVSDTIHVDLLPNPVLTISGDPYICPGDSALLIASGAATYNWLWLGSTNDSVWVSQDDYYTVTGMNSAGCIGVATFEVTVYPASQPVITMNPSNGLICPGDSVQLFCNGAGIFQWEGPSGPIAGNTPTVFVNIPGIYYCIRTDTNGCLYTNVSNTVQVNQYGTPYVLATPSTVLCPGGSLLISVVSNDTSNIQWQPPLSGNSTTQTVTSPGTYTCSITSCGITTMSSVVITMSNVAATITAGGPLTFCNGDSVVLSANSGMANYDWEPGSISQPTVAIYDAGTYTLSTIDAYGCEATSSPLTVTVLPAPLLSVNSASICAGGSATLTASGSTSYSWSTGDNTPGIVVTPSASTSYTVSSTTGSCTSSAISTVTVNPIPVIAVNSPSVCSGQAATLTASGAATYSWSTGDLTNSIVVTPAAGTTYTVTGTSAGCSSLATATVSVLPSPNVTVNPASICAGQAAILSAAGASTYSWSTGAATNSISVSPSTTTSYSVSGTSSGCADTAFALVTVNPLPVLVVNSASICNGQTATLTASGAASYSWSTGALINSITVSPPATTTYSVSGSTSGCTASSTATITVIPVPSVTVNSAVICEGETATLTASGADTYVWSTGDLTNTISVTPSASTTYTITGTTNSCPDTATSNVAVTPNTASLPVVSNMEICAGDMATLTASGSGTIQWYSSPLSGTPIFSGSEFVTPGLSSTTTYYVLSQNLDCKSPLVPVTVSVDDCDNILVPNIFTPNGDGVNDLLFFHSNASRCFHCRIYNRWGTLVYELDNAASGWNGTIMKTGKPASDGVYYYILDYCTSADKKELTGFVQLIRE
ncbi:MAG: hypothetical protein JWO44_2013 [Bacteroidetes bacterium]|nr:hypothetical protein [Bacteroidota bacterium]